MTALPDPRDPAKAAAFARSGYRLVPNLIGREVADLYWSYAHTKFASLQMMARDKLVPFAPSAYGDAALDGLLEYLRSKVEIAAGLRLLPTYGFVRIYKHGDRLPRHRDRPACEVSVSVNMGQEPARPWPIMVEGPAGTYAASLNPGDGLLYRGMDCPHWREPFEGQRLVQVFLHYVDADGEHRAERYDRRNALMLPQTGNSEIIAGRDEEAGG